jgi:protocatechuate 4,5-dioxygenase beta chain
VGQIVAGFGVPHSPSFPAVVAREGPQCVPAQLYREVAQALDAIQPDVVVVFDSDHLNTFFLSPLPTLCIGVSDRTEGPNDGTPAMPHYIVPVEEHVAGQMYKFGLDHGFDLAVNQEFTVDHSILVPLHFLRPQMDVPIVPVFINGIVPPLPRARRCFALGQMVRQAAEALPGGTRVAVLASGDFSNDIGGLLAPRGQHAGTADPEWADTVLEYLRQARIDDLLNEATSDRMARAGNVAGELLNWIAMLGAIGDRKPSFLEPEAHRGHAFGVWRWD